MHFARFFVNNNLNVGQQIGLDEFATKHFHVLRLGLNAEVLLVNGKDGEYVAKVIALTKKSALVECLHQQRKFRPQAIKIDIYQSLITNDKMTLVIQKAVELGANSITPLVVKKSKTTWRASNNKLDHWRKVALSATVQCGRLDLPIINEPVDIAELATISTAATKIVLSPTGNTCLTSYQAQNYCVAIGPESGFDVHEMDILKKNDWHEVKFGSNILRTDTSALAVTASLQALYGEYRIL